MKLLLDTCTFLWAIADPDRLPRRVADLILFEEHEVYLSAADAAGIQSLAVDEESALHVSRLAELHRDPFDRMLVSQAIVHGMTILTPDPLITQYPARTTW
jgi:PIN domain nuclease of toxin-antitoxin system